MVSPEELYIAAKANQMAGNSLSSVYIDRNTKGYVYGVKVYHEDANKASEIAQTIERELRSKYGN